MIIVISTEQCPSLSVPFSAYKWVVRQIDYTTTARTKMRSITVHVWYVWSHMLRGRCGGGGLWLF